MKAIFTPQRFPKISKAILLFCGIHLLLMSQLMAAVTVTAPNLNITTCSYPSDYFSVGDIIIDEVAMADKARIAVGTDVYIVLQAPANFEFNPGVGSVAYTTGRDMTSITLVSVTSTKITIKYTCAAIAKVDKITISDIEVRAMAVNAATATILRVAAGGALTDGTIGTIPPGGATSFGNLTANTTVSAAVIDTSVTTDMCLNVATTIPDITLSEEICPNDFSAGAGVTFTISAPANFTFTTVGTISFTAGADITAASVVLSSATLITITLTVNNAAGATTNPDYDFLRLSGVKVTPITAAAGPSNITRGGGTATIAGIVAGTVLGKVTSVANNATLDAATGGNCLSNTAAFWTTLGNLVITENCPGEISTGGTFIINRPNVNFQFRAGVNPTITFLAGGNVTSISAITTVAATITFTINLTGTDKIDKITISGIQVQGTATSSGNMTRGGTATIAGVPAGTILGALNAQAGAGIVRWVGSAAGGAWSTAANWSGGAVPGTCATVVIPSTVTGTITLAAATTVFSCIVNGGILKADGALTVDSGFVLTGTSQYTHNNLGAPGSTIFAGLENFSSTSTILVSNWIAATEPFAKFINGTIGNLTLSKAFGTWDQQGYLSGSIQKILGTLTITAAQVTMDGGSGGSTELKLGPVVISGTGAMIGRSGAAPAGGNFTLTTGNLTCSGSAYTCLLYQCPSNITWTCNGNLSTSGATPFGIVQGTSGVESDCDILITGNMTFDGTSEVAITEAAFLDSDVNLEVRGTTTFNSTGFVVFLDGGTGDVNFTTADWIITKSKSSAPYNSIMKWQNYGQPVPTGKVTVNVTNDMTFSGTTQIAGNYLVYETTNISACTLAVGRDIIINNSYAGTMFISPTSVNFAYHNGPLVMTVGRNVEFTGSSSGYYTMALQQNAACTKAVTLNVTGDFWMKAATANCRLNLGSGDLTMTVGGVFNQDNGVFRGSNNTSVYTSGNITLNLNSFDYDGGGFIGYYSCSNNTKIALLNVTNNFDINAIADGAQIWWTGLGTLGTTNNLIQSQFIVGGDVIIGSSAPATIDGQFTTSNAEGIETNTITGNVTITAGDNSFNVAQNSGITTGHATTTTVGGNFSISSGTTYLSAETGALTATINGNLSVTGGSLIVKGDDGASTLNVLGGYSQTAGTFALHANTTDLTADQTIVTINSNDDATGDFSQTGGTISFDNIATSTAINQMIIKSPAITFGGAATNGFTRTTAGTSTIYGEIYFARAGTSTFSRPTTFHQVSQTKMYINAGTILDASGSTEDMQIGCAAGITAPATVAQLIVNGTLTLGTKRIFGRSESATQRHTLINVNSGARIRTGNPTGLYDAVLTGAFISRTRHSTNTNNTVNSLNWTLDANSTIEYYGSANQIVSGKYPTSFAVATGTDIASGTTASYKYGILEINHQGTIGTNYCYLAATVAGIGNVFVRNQLALTTGELRLANGTAAAVGVGTAAATTGYVVTVENPATTAITRTNGYLKSELSASAAYNTAKLQWNIGGTTGAHIYPFGTYSGGIKYLPVTFNNSGASGDVSIATTNKISANTVLPGSSNVAAVAAMPLASTGLDEGGPVSVIDRHWDITTSLNPSPGTTAIPAASVTFTYRGEENTMTTISDRTTELAAQHWNGTDWDPAIASGVMGNAAAGSTNSVTISGLTKFSPYVLVLNSNPLPVELVEFVPVCESKGVLLKWTTASETSNDYFTLEKSKDGKQFSTYKVIKGAGTVNRVQNYSILDTDPINGTTYYRLKQTDFNGKENIHHITAATCKNTDVSIVSVRNNSSSITVEIDSPIDANYYVSVYDITGKKICEDNKLVSEGISTVQMNTEGIANGIYFVTIKNEGNMVTKKIILQP